MKMGISKVWGVPVLGVPEDGDITVLPLNDLKGTDVRYKDHMNMTIGACCTVYWFPVRRLGFFTSGNSKDNEPLPDESTELAGIDDPGLPQLLLFIQDTINQYLLWPNWPHLRFSFQRLDVKTDNREFTVRKEARTWKESRREADLPELETLVKDKEQKELMELMSMCPEDPNKASSFQSIVSTYLSNKYGNKQQVENKGNLMASQSDPANSANHGHAAGIKRNSAKEKGKTDE